MADRQQIIEQAWDERAGLSPGNAPNALREAVESALSDLDAGVLRVAAKDNGQWTTQQWLKKAVLLSFRLTDNAVFAAGASDGNGIAGYPRYYDKVATKFGGWDS